MAMGARFAKWGLGLFIFGVFLTFGIIAHYCAGARWPNGELFMQNVTLWWACPWTLSVAAVQAGGLGMVAIAHLDAGHASIAKTPGGRRLGGALALHRRASGGFRRRLSRLLRLRCDLAELLLLTHRTRERMRGCFLGQAFFIAVYFVGAILAFGAARRVLNVLSPAA